MRCTFMAAIISATAMLLPATSSATYPDRPIHLIVSYAAGSVTDTVARLLADGLRADLGQPVIVENRPGATGNIGAQKVATSAPDGYTLLMHSSALALNPWLSNISYDLIKDLSPVIRVAGSAYAIAVRPGLPVNTLNDFLEYARSHPGMLTCGTYGIGSPPHLSLELLKEKGHLDITHVPYSSFSKALTDLVSGQLDCSIYPPGTLLPYVKEGKIRVIAVTRQKPVSELPQASILPDSLKAASVEGYQLIFVPSGTDTSIIKRLRQALAHIIHTPEFAERLQTMSFEPIGDTTQEAAAAFSNDYERFGPIIKALDLPKN